jgi:glutathione S-transferase
MYKLYGALGGASLALHCVLEKTGLEYEFIEVNICRDIERDPEYLKLNRHGQTPTLVFDDTVIIGSAAISIYLADKHRNTELSPPFDRPDRTSYIQWMVYITNTLQ